MLKTLTYYLIVRPLYNVPMSSSSLVIFQDVAEIEVILS